MASKAGSTSLFVIGSVVAVAGIFVGLNPIVLSNHTESICGSAWAQRGCNPVVYSGPMLVSLVLLTIGAMALIAAVAIVSGQRSNKKAG
jgi:hypothetical protein